MKTRIVYYSYTQNTKGRARRIQKEPECGMAEIQTVTPCPGYYGAVVAQGQQEADAGFCPPIRPLDRRPERRITRLGKESLP